MDTVTAAAEIVAVVVALAVLVAMMLLLVRVSLLLWAEAREECSGGMALLLRVGACLNVAVVVAGALTVTTELWP